MTKNGEGVDLKLNVHLNKICKENRQYMRELTEPFGHGVLTGHHAVVKISPLTL